MDSKFKDNKITIIDEKGNEHLLEILFTYDNEERKKSYVFFFNPEADDEIMVMSYDEAGNLFDVDDDEEYAEVEEVFNAYNEDPEIQKIK